MLKNSENNGTEEVDLVTPTPGLFLVREGLDTRPRQEALKTTKSVRKSIGEIDTNSFQSRIQHCAYWTPLNFTERRFRCSYSITFSTGVHPCLMLILCSRHLIFWSLPTSAGFSLVVHYCDVIMGAMASQIASTTIVYSTVHSGADQRKYQSFASLAFVGGIHRWPVNSPHKWPVTRKMFPFDDVSC